MGSTISDTVNGGYQIDYNRPSDSIKPSLIDLTVLSHHNRYCDTIKPIHWDEPYVSYCETIREQPKCVWYSISTNMWINEIQKGKGQVLSKWYENGLGDF